MICRVIPYEGNEPFLFISYCHEDAEIAYPLIEKLASDGYRLWYDDGINIGADWPEIIAKHLIDCHACIEILTPAYAQSHNCRNEINFLVEHQKTIIPIIWSDFPLSLGLKLQLGRTQYLKKYELPSELMLYEKLYQSESILGCKGWSPQYRSIQEEQVVSEVPLVELDPFAQPIPDDNSDSVSSVESSVHQIEPKEPILPQVTASESETAYMEEYSDDELTVWDEPDEEKTVYIHTKKKTEPVKYPKAGLLRYSTGQLYLFSGEKTTFGRSSMVNVQLTDDSHSISHKHFEIQYTKNEGWIIVDNDSVNGTVLNGKPLEGLQPVSLANLSQILVATEYFQFITEPDIEMLCDQSKVAMLFCEEMDEIVCTWAEKFVIGRSNTWPNGSLSNHRTSRIHAYLEPSSEGYILRVSSKPTPNGTFVNDEMLSPGTVVSLKDQDVIRTGSTYHITFHHLDIILEDKTK